MEKLKLEFQIVAPPQRPFGVEADVAVIVIAQLVELRGQLGVRGLVGLLRPLARHLAHGEGIERRRLRTGGGRRLGLRLGDQGGPERTSQCAHGRQDCGLE